MKYVDNVPLNTRIKIDFKKKDVTFDYPYGKHNPTIKKEMIEGTYSQFIHLITIAYIFMCLEFTLIYLINTPLQLFMYGMILSTPYIIMLSLKRPITNHILKHYKKRYKIIFPKLNATISNMFMSTKKVFLFTPENTNTKIEIPYFKNVQLHYEMTKDFKKNIKRLYIKEYKFKILQKKDFINNHYIWKIIITFTKKPQEGYLKIELI